MGTPDEPIPVVWLARGYTAAYDRLHEALRSGDAETALAPLFEALSWLDTLIARTEVKRALTTEGEALVEALRFARGRVHHQWLAAIEYRDDVKHPPVRIGLDLQRGKLVDFVDSNVYIDWCWVPTAAVRGTGRDPKRRQAYDEHLAGKPVRFALGRFRDFTSFLDIASL